MGTNFKELAEFYDTGDFSDEARAAEPVKDSPGSDEPMDSFTVRLPVSVLETVRRIAAEEHQTTGSVIRRMVENAVAGHTSDEAMVPVAALRELISLATEPEQRREQKSGHVKEGSATTDKPEKRRRVS